MRNWVAVVVLLMVPCTLQAQEVPEHAGHHEAGSASLAEAEVAGLLSGAGMGQALAAELNGYPGPKHVVELASELELSPEQLTAAQHLEQETQAKSKALGREIVDLERALDGAFASGAIDEERLSKMVDEIGRLRAALRLNHLSAHLKMADMLSTEQRQRYSELRGYTIHDAHGG
jgi:Spy/CpxP family protein refolding chaperone